MKYCSDCGAPVEFRIPPDETLPRHVCPQCNAIHYLNPKLVIGCVAEHQGRILLCRRAIEPRSGLWTLPAGFMENGESTAQAAARETAEEACAVVAIDALFALVSMPHIDQVHLFYRARLPEPVHSPGPESLETMLLAEEDIPWQAMAFRSVTFCLQRYFADRQAGHFGLHETVMGPPPARPQG